MSENKNTTIKTLPGIQINLRDFLDLCLAHWYWFLICIAVAMAIASVKVIRTPPVYLRSATLLIKETSTRRTSTDLETVLGTGGLNSANSKIANEIAAFRSPSLMEDVVRRINLNTTYFMDARRYDLLLYGRTCPISVDFPELNENTECGFTVKTFSNGTYKLSDFIYPGKELESTGITVASGDTVVTPVGVICLRTNPNVSPILNRDIKVVRRGVKNMATYLCGRLSVTADDIKNASDILNLSFNDVNIERADDVLSTLINIYNENWVTDRNKTATATSEFITERLATLDRDLNDVDSDISSYKSRNLLPDISAVSSAYMTQGMQTDNKIQEMESQLYVSNYILNTLKSTKGKRQLIPLADNISNSAISQTVANYNKILMERNSLATNTSEQNPIVVDMDSQLDDIKSNIISTMSNQVSSIKSQLDILKRTAQSTTARIAASPGQEKYLMSIGRQQKVKEQLYLYLLQKREENDLSQAFTAYNTRLITPPAGNNAPISPNKQRIFLIAFLLGFAIPLVYFYIRESLNTKIRGRKDLENMSIPFLGEIPQYFESRKGHGSLKERIKLKAESISNKFRKADDKKDVGKIRALLVKHGRRDTINEAFRVLRTNIEFINSSDKCNVMLLTSFNISSGKTFVSANLAMSMAIKGIKVLAVDGDLRHASLSNYVSNPKEGLSNYLAGKEDNIDNVIIKGFKSENLDFLPCGTIPPNPAELLGSERFSKLIERLRSRYDYIIIDCPPVEIVADAQIIEKVVDRNIFVVRAGLFDKSLLPEMNKFYEEGKFKNMMVILNGSGAEGTYYGTHNGYGYYGYYRRNTRYGYYGGYHNNGYYGYYNREEE